MMTHVTDNEPPTPPRGMDADEYRRFQEFQRFQDYQRFVEQQQQQANLPVPVQPNQPVAPQPHPQQQALEAQLDTMRKQLERIERVTNPPTWRKVLGNKWLHRALWLVVLVAIGVWGVPALINHYVGGNDNPGGPAALHPGDIAGSGRLEKDPKDAVAAVYHIIAESPPDTACLEFTVSARATFAADLKQPTCLAAVRSVHAGLNSAAIEAYSFVQIPDSALTQQGGTARISSCGMQIDSGPHLGLFVLTENQNQEWQITGHQNEPDPCPPPPSTTVPPTS